MTSEEDEARKRSGAPPDFEFPLHPETILSDAELKAIGCLALQSTSLEGVMELMIKGETGEVVGELLIDQRMISKKLETLKRILSSTVERISPGTERDEFLKRCTDVFGKISSDITMRNTVIHGEWERLSPDDEYLHLRLPVEDWHKYFFGDRRNNAVASKKTGNPVKASEVMDLARRFRDHQIALTYLFLDYRQLLKASQEKSE